MIDPEGKRLPIKLDTTSNGEFLPVPLSAANLEANRLAHEFASRHSRKLGVNRRRFLVSACGAASTLLAFNQAHGTTGGFYDLPKEAALDEQLARAQVGPARNELIFDVQGHFIDTPKGNAKGHDVFIKDVFMDSDTDLMVLSFVPSTRQGEPLTIKAAAVQLGVATSTIHRLINDGIIAGEQLTPGAPWRIRLTDALKARFNAEPGEDYLPMREAIKALSVSRQTVLQRVKRGELEAVHVTRGRQKGLRIKVLGRQTELFEEAS